MVLNKLSIYIKKVRVHFEFNENELRLPFDFFICSLLM